MHKKVLMLSTSFRKGGNSDQLADGFVRGATDSGNKAEKIYLSDLNIGDCRGCWTYQKRGRELPVA